MNVTMAYIVLGENLRHLNQVSHQFDQLSLSEKAVSCLQKKKDSIRKCSAMLYVYIYVYMLYVYVYIFSTSIVHRKERYMFFFKGEKVIDVHNCSKVLKKLSTHKVTNYMYYLNTQLYRPGYPPSSKIGITYFQNRILTTKIGFSYKIEHLNSFLKNRIFVSKIVKQDQG